MRKGLHVQVLRPAGMGDCTNGGVSSKFDHLILTGPGIPGIFEPTPNCPEVRLCVEWPMAGLRRVCARPVGTDGKVEEGGGCWMFGGNFVYSSDARFPEFGDAGDHFPIPLHDRCETAKELARYSSD